VFVGALAGIADVLLVLAIVGESVGAWLFGALIAGGGVTLFLLRAAIAGAGR
jgi:hypothetical protein